jgi:hypothetical protein
MGGLLYNDRGALALTVPFGAAAWIRQKLGDAVVRGPEATLSTDGSARVAKVWVRVRHGMRASVPLGSFGEAGIEAAC